MRALLFKLTSDTMSMFFLVALIIVTLVFVVFVFYARVTDRRRREEIMLYKMYTKPLEELIREIRARQHEFDNHLNAILNMHLTVDNYEDLVRAQSDYIFGVVDDKRNSCIPLLKISDKILAGFLYTKMVSAAKPVEFEAEIGTGMIVTNTPENELIEVCGTLIDNAVDACDESNKKIKLYISSIGADTKAADDDKFIFEVSNEHPVVPMNQMQHFFDKGWSTKSGKKDSRGFGLYNAKRIVMQHKGEITVENKEIDGRNYVVFRIEL